MAKGNLRLLFDLSNQPAVRRAELQLIRGQNKGQLSIGGLSQRVNLEPEFPVSMPPAVLHPLQAAPPLLEMDSSNHCSQNLPSPDRLRISQCNARELISDPWDCVVGPDAAHYQMLCKLGNRSMSGSLLLQMVVQIRGPIAKVLVLWLLMRVDIQF